MGLTLQHMYLHPGQKVAGWIQTGHFRCALIEVALHPGQKVAEVK